MIHDRSIAAYIAVVDATAAGTEDSRTVQGAAIARLPAGYDRTDLKMLEWIAAHRRTRTAMPNLAA